MSSAKQNRSIARLIVGAMSIDGALGKQEREHVAQTLRQIGMEELVADVGIAIEEDSGDFNMFQDCKSLVESLGSDAPEIVPIIFRVITDVIASDRFVSSQEASYLSAMARKLGVEPERAKQIFKQVMAARRGRLEIAGDAVDEEIHPHLKELLSFQGAEDLVGEFDEESIEELMHSAQDAMAEGAKVSQDDVARAMTILGLDGRAKMEDVEEVWRETIDKLNLPKMADLGETFVSAAINRITRINEAYKVILNFHQQADTKAQKAVANS